MSDRARLEVALKHRIGGLALDVAFALTAPWTVLFAPSGAGKSTVLRIIAGLLRPDAGRIVSVGVDGSRTVLGDTQEGVFVQPHRRKVGFVGQGAALFPHMTVRRNMTYGMTGSGAQREELLREIMGLCRVEHVAGKMPLEISGGERQRAVLARALGAVGGSRVLLLDEAFTGLDVGLRDVVVGEVMGWLAARGVAVLQVTHDVGEVFAAGAEVIRMEAGRVAAQGPARQVLREERERLVKQLGAAS